MYILKDKRFKFCLLIVNLKQLAKFTNQISFGFFKFIKPHEIAITVYHSLVRRTINVK